MEELWGRMTPPLRSQDVAKLAVGQKYLPEERFSDWEAVLSEVITNDALGVDRMDYLLRDSLHTGVPAGRVDHFRLIETIRILTRSGSSREPELGVERGGLHSAEALLLARYFMFSQVYNHPVRLIYDIHLNDFLREYLPNGRYSVSLRKHSQTTDIEVMAWIVKAAGREGARGHEVARRLLGRRHFKVLWEDNPAEMNLNAGEQVFQAARKRFGARRVRRKGHAAPGAVIDFPVLLRDGKVESAQVISKVLGPLPQVAFDYVFISPDAKDEARRWLAENRATVIRPVKEE